MPSIKINRTRFALLGVSMLTVFVSACAQYRVTLNEKALYDKPPIFTAYHIDDSALNECVAQSIDDQQAGNAGQLAALNCSDNSIQSLAGLQIFTQLQRLDLSNNKVSDIAPLQQMPGLTHIDLRGNEQLDCTQAKAIESASSAQIKYDPC